MLTSSLRNWLENCMHKLHRSMPGAFTGFPMDIGCSGWRTMEGPASTLPTRIVSRNNACSEREPSIISVWYCSSTHNNNSVGFLPTFISPNSSVTAREQSGRESVRFQAATYRFQTARWVHNLKVSSSHDHPTLQLSNQQYEFIFLQICGCNHRASISACFPCTKYTIAAHTLLMLIT